MQGHGIIMQSNFYLVTSHDSRNIRRMKFYIGGFWGKKTVEIFLFPQRKNVHVV